MHIISIIKKAYFTSVSVIYTEDSISLGVYDLLGMIIALYNE